MTENDGEWLEVDGTLAGNDGKWWEMAVNDGKLTGFCVVLGGPNLKINNKKIILYPFYSATWEVLYIYHHYSSFSFSAMELHLRRPYEVWLGIILSSLRHSVHDSTLHLVPQVQPVSTTKRNKWRCRWWWNDFLWKPTVPWPCKKHVGFFALTSMVEPIDSLDSKILFSCYILDRAYMQKLGSTSLYCKYEQYKSTHSLT